MRRTSHEQRWLTGLDALQDFVAEFGHANVPQHYVSPNGYKLGSWVSMQRFKWPHLATERQRALQQLPGWVVDALEAAWQEGYTELQAYVTSEGHAKVPKLYVAPNGYKLGFWVMTQRAKWHDLATERQRALQQLPGWVVDALEAAWQEGYTELQAYVDREGHANVPFKYVAPSGYKLGSWVHMQRVKWPHLATERQRALHQLPGWVLDAQEAAWQEGYAELQAYVDREGHAKVPFRYVAPSGYKLGVWVMTQRARKNSLLPMRRTMLEALPGWLWRVR